MVRKDLKYRDLRDIFYSGFSGRIDYASLDGLWNALNSEVFLYESEEIVPVAVYYRRIDSKKLGVPSGIGGDGQGHRALKMVAKEWLADRGIRADYEVRFSGGFVDILSEDRRRVIECGNTSPDKVGSYLGDERVEIFSVLPYPFSEDKFLTIHSFTRGPNFLKESERKLNKLREVHRKAHSGNK